VKKGNRFTKRRNKIVLHQLHNHKKELATIQSPKKNAQRRKQQTTGGKREIQKGRSGYDGSRKMGVVWCSCGRDKGCLAIGEKVESVWAELSAIRWKLKRGYRKE